MTIDKHLFTFFYRCLSRAPQLEQKEDAAPEQKGEQKPGWFKNLLSVRTLPPSKESHSTVLSKKEILYELQRKCCFLVYIARQQNNVTKIIKESIEFFSTKGLQNVSNCSITKVFFF